MAGYGFDIYGRPLSFRPCRRCGKPANQAECCWECVRNIMVPNMSEEDKRVAREEDGPFWDMPSN